MKTLLVHFSDQFWFDVAKKASQQAEIAAVVTPIPEAYRGEPEFADAEIIGTNALKTLDSVMEKNKGSVRALSRAEIQSSLANELLFLKITDRNMRVPLSVHWRDQYYYELLLFWISYLERKGIGLVVFQATPHLGYDFVLYAAAKALHVDVRIFFETQIQSVMFSSEDHRRIDKVPLDFLPDCGAAELYAKIDEKVRALFEAPSYWLQKSLQINERVTGKPGAASARSLARSWKRALMGLLPSAKRKRNRTTSAEERKLEKETNRKIGAFLEMYEKMARLPDANDQYLLFAMHYQPERTSLPEGDIFENQLLAIDILSKSIPEGWWLYVKEHPRQFLQGDLRKHHFREDYYYRKISQYKNVKLISVHANQKELIAGSKLVASVKGSVGWEAMLDGKASLTFARAWYSLSNASFLVESVQDCARAIPLALAMGKEQVLCHLYRFLIFNTDKMVLSEMCLEAAQKSILGYEACVENMAKEIVRKTAPAD